MADEQQNNKPCPTGSIALLIINSETPFDKRHDCWFCGEPYQDVFIYSPANYQTTNTQRPIAQFSLPSCRECFQMANKVQKQAKSQCSLYSIWTIKAAVKQYLLHHYRQDLAIGINWTQAELAESEFEQGDFAGFQKSAWFMFEVAKARVNYPSWPLIIDGVALEDEYQLESFSFDGVRYPSLSQAVAHYSRVFSLNSEYFTSVLYLLGRDHFAKAVRFCRLQVNASQHERQRAYRELTVEVSNINR